MIVIRNQQRKVKIDTNKLKNQAQIILTDLGYQDFDLFILLVNDATMHEYNYNYRKIDKATDILSFPFHPELAAGEQIVATSIDDQNLGDIIMCPNYILNDLERWEQSFSERLEVLLVHGICHLLGYDHIEDQDYAIMKVEEERLLAKIR